MEQVPDTFPYLFAGYSVIWGLVVVYMLCLAARLRRVERELLQKSDLK